MAKNFRELEAKMSPESLARSHVLTEKYRAEMPMERLREAREIARLNLGKTLGMSAAAVSKMERYVCEHAAGFCAGDGRGVEDYRTLS